MNQYFADLHIHLGASSSGRPVKITASRSLIFEAVIKECVNRKGIDIAGIVDCAAPAVIKDIEGLVARGELYEMPDGGFIHKERLLVILGSEIEACEANGRVSHHLAFFPFFRQIKEFSRQMAMYIKNMELSSQSAGISSGELSDIIASCGGVHIPAHAFTPHKSLYGRVAARMTDVFTDEQLGTIPAIELGLSADTLIADRISELASFSFLSSSDAHSLPKIGREYTIFEMERPSFKELMLALRNREGRKIAANFGMDPRLGRYNRSYCKGCNLITEDPPPVCSCPSCGKSGVEFVLGVADRISMIADQEIGKSPGFRPPYKYQVPLEFIKGVSPAVINHLIDIFGSEMAVLHKATREELLRAVKPAVADDIILGREGKLGLASGGGGKYGSAKSGIIDDKTLQMKFDF